MQHTARNTDATDLIHGAVKKWVNLQNQRNYTPCSGRYNTMFPVRLNSGKECAPLRRSYSDLGEKEQCVKSTVWLSLQILFAMVLWERRSILLKLITDYHYKDYM